MNSDPIAYFLTWTTYGTWLPGDERGWIRPGASEIQAPDSRLERAARGSMAETALVLTSAQRSLVEETIKAHCRIRGWTLHAVNARRTHVHVVVTADCDPATVMNQLKAWCTRRLKEHAKVKARSASKGTTEAGVRKHWWTEGGSKRYVFDDEGLDQVTDYTLNRQ